MPWSHRRRGRQRRHPVRDRRRQPGLPDRINVIGLGRRGFSEGSISTLRNLYRDLFRGPGIFSERLAAARSSYADSDEAAQLFAFLENAGRNGVCQAAQR